MSIPIQYYFTRPAQNRRLLRELSLGIRDSGQAFFDLGNLASDLGTWTHARSTSLDQVQCAVGEWRGQVIRKMASSLSDVARLLWTPENATSTPLLRILADPTTKKFRSRCRQTSVNAR